MVLGLKRRLIASLLICLSCSISCTHRTNLSIEDELAPSFRVTGGGYELFFSVGEVIHEKDRFGRKELPVWAFKSKQRSHHETWPTIVYGELSDEFKQTFPHQTNPLPLVEGKLYGVHATIYSTSGDSLWFVVKDGKAVEVPKP
jgi:hypothetical protein